MSIIIQNGRLLDPASNTDRLADIKLEGTTVTSIADPGSLTPNPDDEVIDATDHWVVPGLIDMHASLREPGEEYKETIASASQAAVAGGFTTVVAMPDTTPTIDHAEQVHFVRKRGAEAGLCRILPTGAITTGRQGAALAPLAEMQRAGAVALTDSGRSIADSQLMRSALEYSTDFGMPILTHAEDTALTCGGHMHEGPVSTRLGLRGIPDVAEASMVARDILLAEFTGGQLHLCHVSSARAVELIEAAQGRGVKVTAEVAAHHLVLTDEAVEGFNTAAKLNPPLRSDTDRAALIEAVKCGVIQVITSDHSPHNSIQKDLTFANADFGAIGLQTTLSNALTLHHQHGVDPLTVLSCLTSGPAAILGLATGTLQEGAPADLTIIAPNADWEFTPELNLSKSQNSLFLRKELKGRVMKTITEGRVVFSL